MMKMPEVQLRVPTCFPTVLEVRVAGKLADVDPVYISRRAVSDTIEYSATDTFDGIGGKTVRISYPRDSDPPSARSVAVSLLAGLEKALRG